MPTSKTGRRQVLPLAQPLSRYLMSLAAGDDPTAPLFPNAYAARQRSQYSGTLSTSFTTFLSRRSGGEANARRQEHLNHSEATWLAGEVGAFKTTHQLSQTLQ